MRLLFITTHNLATNPRLVKEVELAISKNYSVSVLCFEFENWSKELNEKIKSRWKGLVKYHAIPAGRKPFIPWLKSTLVSRLSGVILNIFPTNSAALSFYLYKRSWLLLKALKRLNPKVDLIVAHNPGSFYPCFIFASKTKIPFGIDMEDYHPGETTVVNVSKMTKLLHSKILPKAKYITSASPLICDAIKVDLKIHYPSLNEVILNTFPSNEFLPPLVIDGKLKLVWFSQHISFGRGLENLLEILKEFESYVELYLYGHLDNDFKTQYFNGLKNVFVMKPVSQQELHQQLKYYDVGLALEDVRSNTNRQLCLTNKVIAYLQSGLFILASNTAAQKKILETNKKHGCLTTIDKESLALTLNNLVVERDNIRAKKLDRYKAGASFSWENEGKNVLDLWGAATK